MPCYCLRTEEHAFHIDPLYPIPIFFSQIDDWHAILASDCSGVVDEDVDFPEMCDGVVYHLAHLFRIRNIGNDANGALSHRFNLTHEVGESLPISLIGGVGMRGDVVDGDIGTFFCQSGCDGTSDAVFTARACY